jgi:hypothetical protein
MNSRNLLLKTLNHREPDRIVFDMGSTAVTGIHVLALENLRAYYGLEKRPVTVIEPYQMLGLVETDLIEAAGIDVLGAWGEDNIFGYWNHAPHKIFKTFWGQEVYVPDKFSDKKDGNGDLISFPSGDTTVSPSAKMPQASYFFDAIERQGPIDDENLDVNDNLEEFTPVSDKTLMHWKTVTENARATGKGVVAGLGGTALGDIALVPGMQLRNPKGIRGIAEWYMSTILRTDYIRDIFDRQSALALENLERINKAAGQNIDVVFLCGTDFGTQDSTFCSPDQFDELWLPYYRRINDWIHSNTEWKTFKHSCGAVENFMDRFIEAGFDIINPVQVSAKGMDPKHLKVTYGKHLTFWGGGINTQQTLPNGTAEQVREEVLRYCDIFAKDGGFVFNTVHNIQANVPVGNIVAMINAIKEFSSK